MGPAHPILQGVCIPGSGIQGAPRFWEASLLLFTTWSVYTRLVGRDPEAPT